MERSQSYRGGRGGRGGGDRGGRGGGDRGGRGGHHVGGDEVRGGYRGRGGGAHSGQPYGHDASRREAPKDEIIYGGETVSNYFVVEIKPKSSIYRTTVDFQGVQSRTRRRAIISALRKLPAFEGIKIVFDGSTIYSVVPLPKIGEALTLDVSDELENTIVLVQSQNLDLGQLKVSQDLAQVFNIILNEAMSHELTRIGRHFFNTRKSVDMDRRTSEVIDVFSGFATEITARNFNNKLTLVVNVDTLSKVVTKQSILETIHQFLDEGMSEQNIERKLRGTVVCTRYNWKTYFIEGVDFKKSPTSTFERRNPQTKRKETIAFAKYYQEIKHPLSDTKQPLIRARGRMGQSIYLMPELCVWTTIPNDAKARLPQIASIKPVPRQKSIQGFVNLLASSKNCKDVFERFNITIAPQMMKVAPKVLESPNLVHPASGGGGLKTLNPKGGDWKKYAKDCFAWGLSAPTTKVTMFILFDETTREFARNYMGGVKTQLTELGAPIQVAKMAPVNVTNQTHEAALLSYKFEETKGEDTEVLICSMLGHKDEKINRANYDALKKYCLPRGYQCQGVNATDKAIQKKQDPRSRDSIMNNLVRQIANKFGHLSWWFEPHKLLSAAFAKTVFLCIGIDVFHAPITFEQNIRQKRSLGAFTAWIMKPGAKVVHFNAVHARQARSEIGSIAPEKPAGRSSQLDADTESAEKVILEGESVGASLEKFVADCIREHKLDTKILHIIVYRDGVAESQLDMAKSEEVTQVKRAAGHAKVTFCVVQKRIHTRFFARKDSLYGNVPQGTIVDKDVNMPGIVNWFLVPTKNTLSTSAPVNYIVLHNDSLPSGDLQKFTWAMHHCYPNWCDTIKTPSPTQCAHKLAYMLGEVGVAKPQVPPSLQKTLWYL